MHPVSGCCGIQGIPGPDFFRALADPNRLRILAALMEAAAPLTVSEVASQFSLDISVVSRHLATLRQAGVLSATKTGKEVRHAINHPFLIGLLRDFAGCIASCCPPGEEEKR